MNILDKAISEIPDLELRVHLSSELNAYQLTGLKHKEVTKSELNLIPVLALPEGATPAELIPSDSETHVFALIDSTTTPSTILPVLSFGLGLFVPESISLSKLIEQVQLLAAKVSALIRSYMSGSGRDTVHIVRPMTCNLETCFFDDPEAHPNEMYVHVYMDAAVRGFVPIAPITEFVPLPKQPEKLDVPTLNAN